MKIIKYKKQDFYSLANLAYEFNNYIVSIDSKKLVKHLESPENMMAYANKLVKDSQALDGFIYLAIDNDTDIGFIQGVVVPKDSELFDKLTHDKYLEGWIGVLYVKEEYRGQGIGRLLYQKAISHFKDKGCIHARLIVLNDNKNALGLYEKNGFETRGLNMIKKL